MRHELNASCSYLEDIIGLLGRFSIYLNNVSLKVVKRKDILSFLDGFRKPETLDPLHKWIGTYNICRIHFMRFFRWLYYPDIYPSKDRPKPAPVENIPQLKRKEISRLSN